MSKQPTSGQGNKGASSPLKELIMEKARGGAFNHNPLISTTHYETCQKCNRRQSVVYLDYLKRGDFDFGKTEQIEVLNSQGPISFLEKEKVTPIIINLTCRECGCGIKARPVSAEYLRAIIDRPRASQTMYA